MSIVADSKNDENYNKTVTLPATAEPGDAIFNAGLLSLYGAAYMPSYYPFNVSFAIGDETSAEYTFVGLNTPVSL